MNHARVQRLGDREQWERAAASSKSPPRIGLLDEPPRSTRFVDRVPPNTHPPLRNRRIKRLRGLERVTKRSIGLSG